MKIAAVTMVQNERLLLPYWLNHYASEFGASQCYIIDHGSDDGSTSSLGDVNIVRIPPSLLNEELRADFVSEFCSSLLKWYDWIIYTDVDEILVADPARYGSLTEYCAAPHPDVVTAFGMNVLHRLHMEIPIRPDLPIFEQRSWVFPLSSMSKPALTRVPIRWQPGFHSSDAPVVFDELFNFHLSYFDYDMVLLRQQKRKKSLENHPSPPAHHVLTDENLFNLMNNWSNIPQVHDVTLGADCRHMTAFRDRILQSISVDDDGSKIDIQLWGSDLWKVPDRFHSSIRALKDVSLIPSSTQTLQEVAISEPAGSKPAADRQSGHAAGPPVLFEPHVQTAIGLDPLFVPSMCLTRDAVIVAYGSLFDRSPSDQEIVSVVGVPNIRQLRESLIVSSEFKERIRSFGYQRDPEPSPVDEIFMIQTADCIRYKEVLNITSRVNMIFAKNHNIKYWRYDGIKRGVAPLHAMYNRIFMLTELLQQGFTGWVMYLDADAFISDMSFRVRSFLQQNNKYMMIIDETGNNGFFMINLGDYDARLLILDWHARFESSVSQEFLSDVNAVWGDNPDDQAILHVCLSSYSRFNGRIKYADSKLFNYLDGQFVKQAIRAFSSLAPDEALQARIEWLRTATEKTLPIMR